MGLKVKEKKTLLYGAGIYATSFLDKKDLSSSNIIGIADRKFQNNESELFKGYKKFSIDSIRNLDFNELVLTVEKPYFIIKDFENTGIAKILKSKKVVIRDVNGQKLHYKKNIKKSFLEKLFSPKHCYNHGCYKVIEGNDKIQVIKGNNCIILSNRHRDYIPGDIFGFFDYYFEPVKSKLVHGLNVVDYSKPKFHDVKGFNLMKIEFPSFPEPYITAQQYFDFAKLNENSVVLDLGGYSGLTAISFDMEISKNNKNASGRVISVEADSFNIQSLKKNFRNYNKKTKRQMSYVQGAIWNTSGEISFAKQENMGSGVTNGNRIGDMIPVKCFTLSEIAQRYQLEKIDFIKCDVEGAEVVIFDDSDFFSKYRPRIIIEPHIVYEYEKYGVKNNTMSTDKVIEVLSKYNYNCKVVIQNGVGETGFPLVECVPAEVLS